jgi:hypothetical protein
VTNIRISEVTVSALPEDHEGHDVFSLKVSWRGGDRYAVMRRSHCLGADGLWDYERRPSNREDEWIATHRFAYDEAIYLARRECLNVRVNGRTVADVLAEAGR